MATDTIARQHFNIDLSLGNWTKDHVWAHSAVLVGRCFYSLIFIIASFGHFTKATVDYAANQGVPLAQLLVPLSGLMALIGGLSILLGYGARIGALLIILFLIPVTLAMHNFWTVADPMTAQLQQAMFMKNVSMLGAALLIFYFGAGPMSFDSNISITKELRSEF